MINWDSYYLDMLDIVRKRSSDKQTQVATILVENKRILSTGYNGWPSGIDNLPDTRQEKYKWMIHGEINAIVNCAFRPTNPICYITGTPCNVCNKAMWNFGVRKIISLNQSFKCLNEDDLEVLFKLIEYGLDFNLARKARLEEIGENGINSCNDYIIKKILTREDYDS